MTAVPPVAPQTPEAPAPVAPGGTNTLGLVGLILAGVGFLLGIIPPTSGIAWLLLIPGAILGIVGLTRKGKPKGMALTALILGVVGWIVSIIVFFVSAIFLVGSAVDGAIDQSRDRPSASREAAGADEQEVEEIEVPGIGDTVVSENGVEFTVNSVTCGLAVAGTNKFLQEEADGQFCEVAFTFMNGTDQAIYTSSSDYIATIGAAEYTTDGVANVFGSEAVATNVNPGISIEGLVYFDIPVGEALDTVGYKELFSFDEPLSVDVS